MKLTIRTRHLDLGPELRDLLHRRLDFALGRLTTALHTVEVTIVDINGPKGGADKQCRIHVRGPALRTIVIEHVGTDVLATVSLAAERAAHAVTRSLARRRTFAPALAT
ncbi:MAG: HPF/RaiA family ribosome-associated protein [Proteobacteria bacterium]|nr:HPF/RaiA family ribosome-associated protein [Pseudomonadota bacterium]